MAGPIATPRLIAIRKSEKERVVVSGVEKYPIIAEEAGRILSLITPQINTPIASK